MEKGVLILAHREEIGLPSSRGGRKPMEGGKILGAVSRRDDRKSDEKKGYHKTP